MRIAIVHYHLKRGGVTRVIESTLAALQSAESPIALTVLAGEVPAGLPWAEFCREVPGLHYSNTQEQIPQPEALLCSLRAAAEDALGGPPDVWHIHNHSLGKNQAMPKMVELLARSGDRLLLQMHDFAEDGRPANFELNQKSGGTLYPTAQHIHYACLNERDSACFEAAGLSRADDPGTFHRLTNPVDGKEFSDLKTQCTELRRALQCTELLLYPVRAVRRKNLGELLLWATCLKPGQALATTLGPTNRDFEAAYQHWQSLAADLKLPVHFGIGESGKWSFESMMSTASAVVSTSIAEGFGLAYLEPWLFGKALIGRDLPVITRDFKAKGVRLTGLYENLLIPEDWVDCRSLERSLLHQLHETYTTYRVPMPPDAVDRARAGITPTPGHFDFGGLDEALQESVIRRASKDPEARRWIGEQMKLGQLPASDQIAANAETIRRHYNRQAYGERLREVYQTITASPVSEIGALDPAAVLKQYLKPENFRLLRS